MKKPRKQEGFKVIYHSEIDKTVTEQEVISKYVKNAEDAYHQIGGYPFGSLKKYKKNHDFLLFQLDMDFSEDDELRIIWDNALLCNFFINSKKLKKLDFSDVWYNLFGVI